MGNSSSDLLSSNKFCSLDRRNRVKDIAQKCLYGPRVERQTSRASDGPRVERQTSRATDGPRVERQTSRASVQSGVKMSNKLVQTMGSVASSNNFVSVEELIEKISTQTKYSVVNFVSTVNVIKAEEDTKIKRPDNNCSRDDNDNESLTDNVYSANSTEQPVTEQTEDVNKNNSSSNLFNNCTQTFYDGYNTSCKISQQMQKNNIENHKNDNPSNLGQCDFNCRSRKQKKSIENVLKSLEKGIYYEHLPSNSSSENNSRKSQELAGSKTISNQSKSTKRSQELYDSRSISNQSRSTERTQNVSHCTSPERIHKHRKNAKLQSDHRNLVAKEQSAELSQKTNNVNLDEQTTDTLSPLPQDEVSKIGKKKKSFRRTAFSRYRRMLEVYSLLSSGVTGACEYCKTNSILQNIQLLNTRHGVYIK